MSELQTRTQRTLEHATERIANADWLDRAGEQLQTVVSRIYERGGATGQQTKNFLHGTWLGHPLHATLTDLPLGFWTTSTALDGLEMIGVRRVAPGADTAVAMGLASAAATAAAGWTDWSVTSGRARRIGLTHALLNTVGALLFGRSLAARARGNRRTAHRSALLGMGSLLAGAYLGGDLAYRERVGVNHAPLNPGPENFRPVARYDDLPEDEPHRVEVDGEPFVLVRRGGQVFALAEQCGHMGGLLSQGKVQDDRIICPRHGSTYALEDGAVINGPSVYPQPCLETRIVEGQVEVRRAR